MGGPAIDEIAHADQVPADAPADRRSYLREFNVELRGVARGPCGLHRLLRLTLIDPWKDLAGIWQETTPEWIRILGTIATTAHVKYDPFGRRPMPS